MSEAIIRGSCLCGGVEFEFTPPVKFCAHCHCSLCRRAHGAGYVTWTGVQSEALRITRGEQLLTSYASSESAVRRFCSICGSSLFFQAERWAGQVHIAVANLLDELPQTPMAHVFFSDRAEWVAIDENLPRLGGPSGTERLAK